MTDGATGLEATIEITEGDYPEIMRIVTSDGEVDAYLESAGIARDVFDATRNAGAGLCASERAALGSSLLYVVEVGEVTDASESQGAITLAASAAASLMASVTEVSNEGLRLADCLATTNPDAAARLRETFELVGLDNDRLRRAVEERSTGARRPESGARPSESADQPTARPHNRATDTTAQPASAEHCRPACTPASAEHQSTGMARPAFAATHSTSGSIRSIRSRPRSVSEYSTRGGTSGYDVRSTSPSASSVRSVEASIFSLMPSTSRRSSPQRCVPSVSESSTSTPHLLMM